MAYTLASASSQYVEQTSIPLATYASDFTIGMWVNDTGGAGTFRVVASSRASDVSGFQFFFRQDTTAVLRLTYLGVADYGTSIASPSGWAFVGMAKRATEVDMYANTTKETISVGTMTAPSENGLVIGARKFNSAYSLYFEGGVAECAVWDDDLTTAEMGMLADGFAPSLVRPSNLVSYTPLVRGLIDVPGGTVSTSGSPSVSAHPRVIYPRRANARKYTTATAGASTIGLLRANAGLNCGPFSLANAGVGAIA